MRLSPVSEFQFVAYSIRHRIRIPIFCSIDASIWKLSPSSGYWFYPRKIPTYFSPMFFDRAIISSQNIREPDALIRARSDLPFHFDQIILYQCSMTQSKKDYGTNDRTIVWRVHIHFFSEAARETVWPSHWINSSIMDICTNWMNDGASHGTGHSKAYKANRKQQRPRVIKSTDINSLRSEWPEYRVIYYTAAFGAFWVENSLG